MASRNIELFTLSLPFLPFLRCMTRCIMRFCLIITVEFEHKPWSQQTRLNWITASFVTLVTKKWKRKQCEIGSQKWLTARRIPACSGCWWLIHVGGRRCNEIWLGLSNPHRNVMENMGERKGCVRESQFSWLVSFLQTSQFWSRNVASSATTKLSNQQNGKVVSLSFAWSASGSWEARLFLISYRALTDKTKSPTRFQWQNWQSRGAWQFSLTFPFVCLTCSRVVFASAWLFEWLGCFKFSLPQS